VAKGRTKSLVRLRNRAKRARKLFGIRFGPGEEKSVFRANLHLWDRNWRSTARELGFEVS